MRKPLVRRNITITTTCNELTCCGGCTTDIVMRYDGDGDIFIEKNDRRVYFHRSILPEIIKGLKTLDAEAKEEGV